MRPTHALELRVAEAQLSAEYEFSPAHGRPPSIPLAVWFAFLLRDDIRAGRGTDDPEALRDFCCWWLIAGHREYPAVWGVTRAVTDIAMDPVATPEGEMPRLLWVLWSIRPDLQTEFDLGGPEGLPAYLCWYRLVAPAQLGYAPPLPFRFLDRTEQEPGYLPGDAKLPRIAIMMLRLAPHLARVVDLGSPTGRRRLAAFYAQQGRRMIPPPAPMPPPPIEPRRPSGLPASPDEGVNLIGFARSEFGLGEDIRMTALALDAAAIDNVVIDIAAESASVARRNDRRLEPRIVGAPRHPVSVFCMSPFDTATLWLRRGDELFDDRYLVGYWVWELSELPQIWHEVALLVDEIWAPSRFVARSLAAQSLRPVRLRPAVVEPGTVPLLPRRALGLPERKFLFICPFDPNSSLRRKNPAGAVRAFRRAFPSDRRASGDVALILRVNGAAGGPGWDEVEAAIAGDRRIVVIEGTMERPRALAMLRACDCLVSLHRAEGYGRNIAEAKRLGRRVIATAYSGCMDFLAATECVGFDLVPVGADYPFGAGLNWAEPDIGEASRMMRDACARACPQRKPGPGPHRRMPARNKCRPCGLSDAGRQSRRSPPAPPP